MQGIGKIVRIPALGAAILLLAGCITPYPDLTQSRSPCRNEPGGWCDFVRDIAVDSYAYAMLSSNAYRDEDEYTALPAAFEERTVADNDDSGLAYSVFDRFTMNADGTRGDLAARVIAFRGTEFGSASDIFYGSFGMSQQNNARELLRDTRSAMDAAGLEGIPIELTGHSLGGALAIQLSIENAGIRAYVFNASPFFRGDPAANDNDRISVSERDEFLRVLRKYKAQPAANALVINCSPSSSAGQKHSIRNLGDCLTWIAAHNEPEAFDLLARNNIAKPEIECDENIAHPGLRSQIPEPGEVIAPCIHSPKPIERS